jgi:DNA-directed RNA polymerase I subunit RPA2
MAKQTMGTPLHSWVHRTDTKLFRLTTPQAPLVQNAHQRLYGFDEYPNGANACVAVIAYTGFDMEDACIINKSAFERGFGWASVYKTYDVDLLRDKGSSDAGRHIFHNQYVKGEQPVKPMRTAADAAAGAAPSAAGPIRVRPGDKVFETLDEDGLPPVGLLVKEGDPLYSYLDVVTSTHRVVRHKEIEPAYVDEVRVLGPTGTSSAAANTGAQRVSIKLRFDRRPVVGDKFSSRHGQKGVLSFLWPQENMPFNDQGMTPDVIINPHAFPSRMTIGMLVEMMAGKAGALHGTFQDATPFRFGERQRAVDHFGQQLRAAGYNYHGTETFYSGITGEPLACDIYYGVVYYQRLRHMVKDKAQVRSTGPINNLTRQPVKGRKKGGGIRFGEMERDSLLAHGAAFLLHDRLMNCSDRHIALVCKACGSLLAPHSVPATVTTTSEVGSAWSGAKALVAATAGGIGGTATSGYSNLGGAGAGAGDASVGGAGLANRRRRQPVCRACSTGEHVVPVPVPYVFRYLANELAAMNIRIKLEVGEGPYGPAPAVV